MANAAAMAGALDGVRVLGGDRKLLINLFINSIHAMADSGELKIKGQQEDSSVRIEIADTGYGIPEENTGKIFYPFFTTKPTGEGTDLGLWLTYEIIRNYNGEIAVKSEQGKGRR